MMKAALRWTIAILIGLALGVGFAIYRVKSGAIGSVDRLGAWTVDSDIGSTRASAMARAIVSLRGLLALPVSEARYYNATVDDAGQPLNGRCRYRLSGGAMPAKWWSVTLYDHDGYLVANKAGIYSISGSAVRDPNAWQVTVSPDAQSGPWLPTGGIERFELTLRTYLPQAKPMSVQQLPKIERLGCA